MNKKSEYIKPSYTDIDILKEVQSWEEELNKKFKEKRTTDIGFNISLGVFILGFFFISTSEEAFSFFSGVGGFILLLFSISKYSYLKGDGKRNIERIVNKIEEQLKEVECKYTEKEGRYYVYLEDGRKIEVNEY